MPDLFAVVCYGCPNWPGGPAGSRSPHVLDAHTTLKEAESKARIFRNLHVPADGHDVRVIQVPFPSREELDADRRR